MIFLYTGKPGAGKTLFALHDLVKFAKGDEDGRPVYISGVRGLKLDHPELAELQIQELENPEEWGDCPDGSIILIDEAQRIFRPRKSGSGVPHYEADLETHRHRGLDFFLTTQGPHLLTRNLHPLIDKHTHLHRGSARQGCWRYVWAEAKLNPRAETAKQCAETVANAPYPKNVYDWYQSAEVHTHKWRVPWRLLLKVCLPLLLIVWSIYWMLQSELFRAWFGMEPLAESTAFDGTADGPAQPFRAQTVRHIEDEPDRLDEDKRLTMGWKELFTAEIEGQPWTAPIYREVAANPVDFPRPYCVVIQRRHKVDCLCHTQQATRIPDVPLDQCMNIAAHGMFDWSLPPSRRAAGDSAATADGSSL